jgi:protein CpxP
MRSKLLFMLMPSPVCQTYRKGNALMKSVFKPLLLVALLATAGFSVLAQAADDTPCMMGGAGPMQGHMGYGHMGKRDGSRMQAHMDKRHAALKTQLKLTPAQESAWTSYTATMKPPADLMKQHQSDQAELAKLSTPERIDKMKTMRTQHMNDMNAAMDKRGDATKTFYATLTPEQQKVFDTHMMRPQGKGRYMGGQMEGRMGMDGKAPAAPAKP